jgi:hypothetical protein
MENTEIIDKIKSSIECTICFEKFIKLSYERLCIFYEDNKNILPQTFEDDNCCRCFEDRFECLVCKNIICRKCYWSFENHKYKPTHEADIELFEYCGGLDEYGLVKGCPGEDCPIICPFCRTKDYKIFYGNKIPYELLNEIKNKVLKYENI